MGLQAGLGAMSWFLRARARGLSGANSRTLLSRCRGGMEGAQRIIHSEGFSSSAYWHGLEGGWWLVAWVAGARHTLAP